MNGGIPKAGQKLVKDVADSDDGEFSLRDGGWCLDVDDDGHVQMASCSSSPSQKWRSDEGEGASRLINVQTSSCLQADRSGEVTVASCSEQFDASQRWSIGDDGGSLRGGAADQCLDYKPEPLETRLYREAEQKYSSLLNGQVFHTDAPEGEIVEV
ncbi:hypothetical protein FOZ63_026803 [Perkinsus olseni]|uniref:Ricin B lectin domain-containing protein n=1 Tax=Perkinsus olseni TaxID=32597 RepID=A0A7J6NUS5_PEROL|nr:hypothetical protein FOZ63_026803 [Perkinsus olseni]